MTPEELESNPFLTDGKVSPLALPKPPRPPREPREPKAPKQEKKPPKEEAEIGNLLQKIKGNASKKELLNFGGGDDIL